uniref:Uncharacterized protein n=1 Tax=Romanomermis culicivorax TaxID=13658 RepID=A0A915JSB7_ROMCU
MTSCIASTSYVRHIRHITYLRKYKDIKNYRKPCSEIMKSEEDKSPDVNSKYLLVTGNSTAHRRDALIFFVHRPHLYKNLHKCGILWDCVPPGRPTQDVDLPNCWYSECAYKSNFMLDDYDDYGKEFDYRFGRMSRSRSASSREDKLGEDESQEQTEQAGGGKELGELMKQMPSMNAMNRRYNSNPDFQDSRYDYGYGNKDGEGVTSVNKSATRNLHNIIIYYSYIILGYLAEKGAYYQD